jgi:hypothetical protein
VGPRAGLDAVEQRKISCPTGNRTFAVQPVARRYIPKDRRTSSYFPSQLELLLTMQTEFCTINSTNMAAVQYSKFRVTLVELDVGS